MDLVYQNKHQSIKVCFDGISNIIMIQFEGVVSHEDYQQGYTKLIELTKSHGVKKFIYHTKKLKKVSVKSRTWYLNHVASQIIQPGVLFAVVNAENIGNQVATETMQDALMEMGYTDMLFERFDTYKEALIWLDSRQLEK
ncbi:MAG: hypothetical protein ACPGJS_02315 [Flammeovirgaceae bacterium]